MPLSCNYEKANERLDDTITLLENSSSDAVVIDTGDFNRCDTKNFLNTYQQYIQGPTRENITLDLFFSNVRSACNVSILAPLGDSDHSIVHLVPAYKQKLKTSQPRKQQ
jgi:hypothetical protein